MELIDGYQTYHQVLYHWTLERRVMVMMKMKMMTFLQTKQKS